MKLHKPMRWKEGMFLRPQHFQQYDLFIESREISRFMAVESHAWGLLRMDVDENALDNYVFNLNSFRAVLPNGTLVDLPGNASMRSRSFDGLMVEIGRSMGVYVGVRAIDDRGPLTSSDGSALADTRFLPAEEEFYDLDTGRDPVPLERLAYNLRIFFGDEKADGYETIQVAHLELTGDAGRPVRRDPEFSPPALALGASPVLHGAARAVAERLALGVRELGQERGGNDPDPLILYYGMSGSLPVIRDMVEEGLVHPRRVYHELARLAGALLFRDPEGRSADEIPPYNHREPGPIFTRLRELIDDLSAFVIAKAYQRCPMERDGDLFRVVIPDSAKKPGTRIFVGIHASAEDADVGVEDQSPRADSVLAGQRLARRAQRADARPAPRTTSRTERQLLSNENRARRVGDSRHTGRRVGAVHVGRTRRRKDEPDPGVPDS